MSTWDTICRNQINLTLRLPGVHVQYLNSLHNFNHTSVTQVLRMKIIISLSRCDRDITPNLMTMQDRILWDSLGECERFDLANERVKLNQIRLLRRERKTKVPGEKISRSRI